jgi:hypothetical protein
VEADNCIDGVSCLQATSGSEGWLKAMNEVYDIERAVFDSEGRQQATGIRDA